MHYLLFKHKYILYRGDENFTNKNFLVRFYHGVKEKLPHLSADSIKSFAIDNCIHLPAVKKQLLSKVDFSTSYQLQYDLLSLPVETKATIFDEVTK